MRKEWILLLCLVMASCSARKQFYKNEGYVFGTYYNIRYEAEQDLETEILQALQGVDQSLSMFNAESTISKINHGESVETDSLFEVMYETALQVSELSNGAFDITVRPLVNAWGFGNKRGEKQALSEAEVDSIRQHVGYRKIHLHEHQLLKDDAYITLDASAIAKGFGVDIAASVIAGAGSQNYLVDIGGEVVAKGHNQLGKAWRVGISKPNDDPEGLSTDLQDIIETHDMAMATSGNYRQFYMDGAVRRSHTIDPRTGYPVQHSLLSATVVSGSCMQADALATACMVLGAEQALEMIERTEGAECYLIVANGTGTEIITSTGWKNAKK